MQRAVGAAFVALLFFAVALLLEDAYITDSDLRYPIVLLTEVLGSIIMLILTIRLAMVFIRRTMRATDVRAEESIRAIGTVLLVTLFSLVGLAFGIFLIFERVGTIQLWPLGIVLIFGALGAYGTSNLWGAWKEYRRLSGKQ
jgi:hypothetical protein